MPMNTVAATKLFYKPVRYEIPEFQRPYVWGKEEQWEPFWEDVRNTAENSIDDGEDKAHFVGAIVLQQVLKGGGGVETHVVVDGQQRLTTVQILLDAVQEALEIRGYTDLAAKLSYLVANPEMFLDGDPDNSFKVWPTINDQDSFRHAMANDLSNDAHQESRIVQAHNFFRTQVDLWLDRQFESGDTRSKASEALAKAVSDLLELVVIDLTPTDDPHIIFETLNARGTPLLQSEMIKNRILYEAHSSGDTRDASALWSFDNNRWWRGEIGRGRQRRPRIDIFLNNWLTMRQRTAIRANNEFNAFKDYAEDARKRRELSIAAIAEDIGKIGDIYRDLEQQRKPGIETFLYRREVMQVGVITPVLLWLFASEVPQLQIAKGLRAVESYLVRRMANGLSTRSYGQLFINLLRELEQAGTEQAGDTIVRYLASQRTVANIWPDDQMLLNAFLTAPLYWSLTQGRMRLILEGIESELRSGMAERQDAPRNLTIEHVMPQSWRQFWPLPDGVEEPGMAGVQRDRIIHSIGNLTLVNSKLNPCMSNGPWHDKRAGLDKHSVLFLNKDLLRHAPNGWNEKAIDARARRLCQAAIKVWPHADGI